MMTMDSNPNYEIFNEELEFRIKEIADFINAAAPKDTATIVLLAKQESAKLSFFFMSNLSRQDMLNLLRSYIKSEEEKDQKQ